MYVLALETHLYSKAEPLKIIVASRVQPFTSWTHCIVVRGRIAKEFPLSCVELGLSGA